MLPLPCCISHAAVQSQSMLSLLYDASQQPPPSALLVYSIFHCHHSLTYFLHAVCQTTSCRGIPCAGIAMQRAPSCTRSIFSVPINTLPPNTLRAIVLPVYMPCICHVQCRFFLTDAYCRFWRPPALYTVQHPAHAFPVCRRPYGNPTTQLNVPPPPPPPSLPFQTFEVWSWDQTRSILKFFCFRQAHPAENFTMSNAPPSCPRVVTYPSTYIS